jgi:hypothetical protein
MGAAPPDHSMLQTRPPNLQGVSPGDTRTIKVKNGSGDSTRTMSLAPAQNKNSLIQKVQISAKMSEQKKINSHICLGCDSFERPLSRSKGGLEKRIFVITQEQVCCFLKKKNLSSNTFMINLDTSHTK